MGEIGLKPCIFRSFSLLPSPFSLLPSPYPLPPTPYTRHYTLFLCVGPCTQHGVAPGIHLTEGDQAKEWLAKGMRFFTFQNDVRMLMDAGKANTTQLREFIGRKG